MQAAPEESKGAQAFPNFLNCVSNGDGEPSNPSNSLDSSLSSTEKVRCEYKISYNEQNRPVYVNGSKRSQVSQQKYHL